eukprot:6186448-Pleurochrysis_carterae.AAC.2
MRGIMTSLRHVPSPFRGAARSLHALSRWRVSSGAGTSSGRARAVRAHVCVRKTPVSAGAARRRGQEAGPPSTVGPG